ncbi:c-type cytochrome [Luteibacter sp. 9135]|uniref:c-type cytochrome n=1 Tax=Luteibacter sp. 9135 TaxID=1500893 RepID=UPI000569F287|nr:c-type cytochrome [Luteibacter sp. 9135]
MRILIIIALLCFATLAPAATLTLDTGKGVQRLTTAQLLARPDVRVIDVPGDVSYHAAMRYRAVPLKALLPGIDSAAHLQFVAMDGFAAELPASLVLGKSAAEAWLAIEPPDAPWPMLGKDKPGAGPFYLVWRHPEASHIGPEQWPYQIAAVRLLADPATRFPKMRPAADLPPDDPARRGFAVFQRNCLSCHTLNGQGDARLGPDLNIPHSPTDYLREDMLRTLIRNPQSLRQWPQAKMPGFSPDTLSDHDLDDLITYLKHMAAHRAAPTPTPTPTR